MKYQIQKLNNNPILGGQTSKSHRPREVWIVTPGQGPQKMVADASVPVFLQNFIPFTHNPHLPSLSYSYSLVSGKKGTPMASHCLSKLTGSVLFLLVLLLFFEVSVSFSGPPPCDFPAIFNFGDSNSDTGGLSAAFGPAPQPNGETFFGAPAGRYSDGRLIIDFIGMLFYCRKILIQI